jgi:CopG antitoxin of type II toxin-antitoxin system
MKGNRSKNLPAFRSVDELVAFFETHDMGEYWEKLPKAEVEVRLKNLESKTNTGKRWTTTQVRQLRQLASQNTPTRVIGLKLGRTENAVRTKASEKGVSLKSRTQSSFYRRKK